MNARTDRPDISEYRMSTRSHDRGKSWNRPVIDKEFGQSYRCDAGLAYGDGSLVLSKGAAVDERSRMTVSLSRDGGKSWFARRTVFEGAAYYSDLAVLPDGTFGLLYVKGRLNRWRGRDVAFARFNSAWITDRSRQA